MSVKPSSMSTQTRDFPTWEQATSRVLYYFATCVNDQLLCYIWDAKTPKDAWSNLKKIFTVTMMARDL